MTRRDQFCFWLNHYLRFLDFECEFYFVGDEVVTHIANGEYEARFAVAVSAIDESPLCVRDYAADRVTIAIGMIIGERMNQADEDYDCGEMVNKAIGGLEL